MTYNFSESPSFATQIRNVLSSVVLPGCTRDLVSEERLENIHLQESTWVVVVNVKSAQKFLLQETETCLHKALSQAFPDTMFRIVLTQSSTPSHIGPKAPRTLEGVRYVVAVGSGKGGVGKSTTALNIACSLATLGWRVGILDGDIYGPSLPKMLKTDQPVTSDGRVMQPLMVRGLKVMSMGFLVPKNKPVVWRGPMVHHALRQMLFDVAWAPLECLVIDLPPGTGDAHLTLTQQITLSGAIIVSTPQEVALIDARKALAMFQVLNTPILGWVENMSLFHCPHCHHETAIFQSPSVQREAELHHVPFLGSIPLDPMIGHYGDQGTPLVWDHPLHLTTQVYQRMAQFLQSTLLKTF